MIIVAGYQEYLWNRVLGRIKQNIPNDYDACICVPGLWGKIEAEKLKTIAEEYQWSFLQTRENKLALTQNMAIELHPNANWIYKFDEDIFIGENYFDLMKDVYNEVLENSPYYPGPIFPVFNVNGFTTEYFLSVVNDRKTNKKIKQRCNDRIFKRGYTGFFYTDQYIAYDIWSMGISIDRAVEMFKNNEEMFVVAPVGVMIGAFLISRDFWKQIGEFKLAGEGVLSIEEQDMLAKCMLESRVACVATRVFAGHFGFGHQKQYVKKLFDENSELFD